MMRKLVVMLLSGVICLAGVAPVLAQSQTFQTWATPQEYERATGKKIEEFYEAPELRVLVAKGELPSLEERLPEEPLVVLGFDGEIGKYGGIFIRGITSPASLGEVMDTNLIMSKHSWTADIYPNICKSYEMRDEGREWIINLRKGLKWSDGTPYTADDAMFWYEDVALNEEITPNFPKLLENAKIEKIDDYAIRIRFSIPTDLHNRLHIGRLMTLFPKHYLKQFHPRYVDKDKLDKMTKEEGFDTWFQLFLDKADYAYNHNVDRPTLGPWMLVQAPPKDPVIYSRNPYYWAVDPAGQQLPYLDEQHQIMLGSFEVVNLRALAGELDWTNVVGVKLFALAKEEEQKGKVRVFRWGETAINAAQLEFNLTHKDPVIRKIFQDKRFRFAVSHAIDRDMISELVYLGMAEPWQVAPYETSPFYHEKLAHTALEYDLKKANRLLDEIGLDKKDADGWRLRPDGKPLQITFISYDTGPMADIGEIVMDNLKAVGLNCNLRFVDFGFLIDKRNTNAHDAGFLWGSWGTNEGLYLGGEVNHFVPIKGPAFWSTLWYDWYSSKGERGEKPTIPAILEVVEAFEKASATMDPEEQKKWFKKVLDIAADNLWTIGTVKYVGYTVITSPKLRNVPTTFVAWGRGDNSGRIDSWFFAD